MPNIKSAKKRLRTSEKARVRNTAVKTRVKNTRRKFMEATSEGLKEGATDVYREYCSVLDKAAKKGVIGKNTASRRKARAANIVRAAG